METEKNVFNLPTGYSEVTVREGAAIKLLPILEPVKAALVGVIGSPYEYLLRRINKGQFIIDRSNLVVDREQVSMVLTINDDDARFNGTVSGKLTKHPKFLEFGINDKKRWTPNDLGQFLKMNRSFFPSIDANRKLVSDLKSFTGKVNTIYEREQKDNGSFKDNYSGVVTTNLPPVFNIRIPIFKGTPAVELEIELISSVDGKDIYLNLCSPAAMQLFEETRDQVIDDQILLIRKIAPEIAIIEK